MKILAGAAVAYRVVLTKADLVKQVALATLLPLAGRQISA